MCRDIFLYSVFCFNIAIIPMGVFCDDGAIYGAIFQRSNKEIIAAGYTFKKQIPKSTKINELIYNAFTCGSTDINECWERIKKESSLKNIPKDNIFIKIFYSYLFNDRLLIEEQLRLRQADTIFVKEFLNIKNVAPIEEYSFRDRNIYWWAFISVGIEYEIVRNITTIILDEDILYISFIASSKNNFPTNILYNVKYNNSEEYTVTANKYLCSSILEVNYFIYQHLMQNSAKMDKIEHPCMPINSFVTFNPSEVKYTCVQNFGFNTSVTFIGLFNEMECHSLIKKVLIQKIYKIKNQLPSNFAGINLPLPIISNNQLMIKTKWFGASKNEINIKKFLMETKQNACGPLKQFRQVLLNENKCFQGVYLEYLLENIVGFSGDNWFIENRFVWPEPFKLYIFSDPRFGLSFTNVTESTFALSTSAISDVKKSTDTFSSVGWNIAINMVVVVILLIGLCLYIRFEEYAPNEDGL